MEASTPAFAFGASRAKLTDDSPATPNIRKSDAIEDNIAKLLTSPSLNGKKTQEEELAEEFEQFKKSTTSILKTQSTQQISFNAGSALKSSGTIKQRLSSQGLLRFNTRKMMSQGPR